jgi:catechol-2,3-dioxygenase
MQDRVFLEAGGAPTGVPQMIVLMPLGPESSTFASPRPLHHLALEISASDFDSELERLQGLGYKVRVGRHPVVPAKTMYIDDPDGNKVALICKK